MKIYGLIGNPLTHSFSQKYFTERFRQEGITGCSYLNFEIKDPSREIALLKKDPHICGLNVTIPYKFTILSYLDDVSPECEAVGACNCINIHDGRWAGFNTDIKGFERSFTPALQPHHRKALVLGTGGSSKAVAYILKKLGIEMLFVSRNREGSNHTIGYNDITAGLLQQYPIVINTSPVGMYPNVDAYPQIPYDKVTALNYFFDLIYNPSRTLFLAKAEARGAVIENGAKMLEIQAEESWKIWTA
jgi:shikimate dehydrogenase